VRKGAIRSTSARSSPSQPNSLLSWIFVSAFSLCDTTGSDVFVFSLPLTTGVLGLKYRNSGRNRGSTDLDLQLCQPFRQQDPPIYDIPSQRISQAFLFSGICSAGIQGTGATCFFSNLLALLRRAVDQKKNLDWLYFQVCYSAWQRLDRKQDSTQPQAGATCYQKIFSLPYIASPPLTDNTLSFVKLLRKNRRNGRDEQKGEACMVFS